MSLINEALKRTRDSSYQTRTAPAGAPAYRVASTSEPGAFRSNLKIAIAAAIGCVMIAIATTSFIALRRTTVVQNVQEPVVLTPPKAEPAPPPATEPVEEPVPAAVAPVVVAAPQPVADPPKLVLQGITGQGNVREAMINGYTVLEGEEIEGARVLVIEARRVKFEFAGREFVLRLP